MSVDFSAGVLYGWKIPRGEYEKLPEDLKDDYGCQTNCYVNAGDYFIGVKQFGIGAGYSREINPDTIEMSPEDYEKISAMMPDIVKKYPNPSIYLYCSVT